MEKGVQFLMKKNKIDVIEGEARLEKGSAAPKVIVKGKDGKDAPYDAKHVILATGARAREIPAAGLKADGKRIWTYRDAMTPPEWPESLLVFGSGAIGIEFASFYAAFGVKVTVVELLDRVLAGRGRRDLRLRQEALREGGAEAPHLHRSEGAEGDGERRRSGGFVQAARNETLTASHAIVAVGITGNIENLGLEALGVKTEKGHIVTDGYGKTNVAGPLRHRRRHRRAVAGAQGQPRRHHLRRSHRRPEAARDDQGAHPRLHLFASASRQRRPHRSEGESGGPRGARRPLSVRRQRQGHRARRPGWLRHTALGWRLQTPWTTPTNGGFRVGAPSRNRSFRYGQRPLIHRLQQCRGHKPRVSGTATDDHRGPTMKSGGPG